MLIETLTFYPRIKLFLAMKKRLKALEGSIKMVRNEKRRAQEHNSKTMICVHEASLYLLLFSLDLSVFTYHLALEQNELQKSVYAKHIASLLFEFFDDFPQVMGLKLRNIIKDIPNSGVHLKALQDISKGVSEYRKMHEKEFKQIRNIVSAHKDLDGELQFKTLESIKTKEMQKLALDFDVWFNKVLQFLTEVTKDYAFSPQMLREIVDGLDPTV